MKMRLLKNRNLRNGIAGLLTGLCNGLFGAGGGVVAVVALEKICGLSEKRAHATALGIVMPLCAVSSVIYLYKGTMDWAPMPFVVPGLILGSYIGAKLLGRLDAVWINRIFSALMLAAGLRMAI